MAERTKASLGGSCSTCATMRERGRFYSFTATVVTCPKCGEFGAGEAHGYVHHACGGAPK